MSGNSAISSPKAEMLLMSAGPTTKAIQEHLLAMGQRASKGRTLQILRIVDGWQPWAAADRASYAERIAQRVESQVARLWSDRCLKYVLGTVLIRDEVVGDLDQAAFADAAKWAHMLVGPSGNTYLTMRGLLPHRAAIRDLIAGGLPYVGESAGTIVAGATIRPAGLKPADTRPANFAGGGDGEHGLNLLNGDIVVHAAGRENGFAIPGPLAKLSSLILSGYETPSAIVDDFVSSNAPAETYVLNDLQALSVNQGTLAYI